ncbi:hypothetical protein [Streptomyces sp. ISL-11]|uniref:hypothetical protein n=1 Tax=Streptomyces sp. ISL-11 TaxID=2819174 RepID=UPI001BEA0C7C|nr:hypothetical protein [Streptomyces sp. ISL-11]MBT2382497.1 hypothetical protein [Streptomyces sp. ISL-11]
MDDKGESEAKRQNKRLELSVAQVSGSAVAAVIAALLAGKLGVYGTVIGAGVVSVVATSGGTIFQHLFRRTGEQLREATTQAARPKMRQVPVRDAGRAVGRGGAEWDRTQALRHTGGADGTGDADATRLLPGVDAAGTTPGDDATRLLHGAGHPPERNGAHAGAHSHPRADAHADVHPGAFPGALDDEYTTGTTHGTRMRGWKRPLLAAGAVFVLAMGTVTAVELVKGSSADGGDGTSVMQIVKGGSAQKKQDTPPPAPDPGRSHGGGQDSGTDEDGPSSDPHGSRPGGGTGEGSPNPSTPSPTPSEGGSSPSPKPGPTGGTPSPDSGKGGDKVTGGAATGGQATGGGQTAPPPQGQNAAAGTVS